jgi:hypothetical protein
LSLARASSKLVGMSFAGRAIENRVPGPLVPPHQTLEESQCQGGRRGACQRHGGEGEGEVATEPPGAARDTEAPFEDST